MGASCHIQCTIQPTTYSPRHTAHYTHTHTHAYRWAGAPRLPARGVVRPCSRSRPLPGVAAPSSRDAHSSRCKPVCVAIDNGFTTARVTTDRQPSHHPHTHQPSFTATHLHCTANIRPAIAVLPLKDVSKPHEVLIPPPPPRRGVVQPPIRRCMVHAKQQRRRRRVERRPHPRRLKKPAIGHSGPHTTPSLRH